MSGTPGTLPSPLPRRLSVGLGILTGQVRPGSGIGVAEEYRGIVTLARAAEAAGLDSVWLSEHHGADDAYLPSLLPMLGAVAAVTERIQLGTAVLIPALHHPLRLAEDVAVVDQLSGGRVVLGLGLGWRAVEFETFGARRAERASRTAEAIAILRQAFAGDDKPFHGVHHHFARVDVRPRPFPPGGPPILLAGSQERPIRRAARVADGLLYSRSGPTAAGAQPDTERLTQALDWVADERRTAAAAGPFGVALCLNVVVARGDPWAVFGPGVDHQFLQYLRWKREDAGLAVGPDDERAAVAAGRRLTLAGPPDEVAAALRPWVAAVVPRHPLHLVVKLHYPGVPVARTVEALDLFAAEVLPALRRAAAAPAGHERTDGPAAGPGGQGPLPHLRDRGGPPGLQPDGEGERVRLPPGPQRLREDDRPQAGGRPGGAPGRGDPGGRTPISGPGTDRSMVFQSYGLLPWRTVMGNVELGLEIRGMPRAPGARVAQEQIERLGLAGFERHYPSQLSGGMQQRVALARAFTKNPRLLLMDEPFAAVDLQMREYLQDELLKVWEQVRTTVIFVTHSIDEALYLGDRVVMLGTRGTGVRADVAVDLQRPRYETDVKSSPRFGELRHLIREALRGPGGSPADPGGPGESGEPGAGTRSMTPGDRELTAGRPAAPAVARPAAAASGSGRRGHRPAPAASAGLAPSAHPAPGDHPQGGLGAADPGGLGVVRPGREPDLLLLPHGHRGRRATPHRLRRAARALLESLQPFAVGWGLAIVLGIGAGLLMGRYRAVDAVLDSQITALYSTPTVALIPLFILWLGLGFAAKVAIIFLSALFAIAVNAYGGVKSVAPDLIDVGRVERAREDQTFRKIIVPASLPFVMTGIHLSVAGPWWGWWWPRGVHGHQRPGRRHRPLQQPLPDGPAADRRHPAGRPGDPPD